jgi:hypothetical protein
MRPSTANFIASSIALLVLVGMVTVSVVTTRSGAHFWLYETLGCLLTVPLAFAMWSGTIWNRGDKPIKGPATWKEWLILFLVGTGTSAVFLLIDIYISQGHPGIGAIFTVGAMAMSVVALPSALRAWLLELLQTKFVANHSDV